MASVTTWTRLEPRARGKDLAPSLEGRTSDPLWMLGRQWQVGEFQGEDAGSPVAARLRGHVARLTAWRAGPGGTAPAAGYDPDVPLEALVEREEPRPDLRLAVEVGQELLRRLTAAGLEAYLDAVCTAYPLPTPPPHGDPDTIRLLTLFGGRAPDGDAAAAALRADTGGTPTPALGVAPADAAAFHACTSAWVSWYDALYLRPAPGQATWDPPRLEYAFTVGAGSTAGDVTLRASRHPGGRLDWADLDVGSDDLLHPATDEEPVVVATLAAPAAFPGMPARRWWQFEDSRVNLGGLDAAPEDLARLLLAEFASVYGNDWYLLPLEVPVGSVTTVTSLVVLDTFGERTLVERAADADWSMFELSHSGATPEADTRLPALFLAPAVVDVLEGSHVEDVLLTRDERANVAWAVERVVQGLAGGPVDRFAQWLADRAERDGSTAPAPVPTLGPVPPTAAAGKASPVRYELASDVPDHWIPLLPVETAPGRVELRRGEVRRPTPNGELRVQPRGRVLLPGQPLAFPSEEVPREGVHVTRGWQHTRAPDGSTVVWLGRRVRPGRGESSSGLTFDRLRTDGG
jgi:hypothetical protein